MSYFRAMPNALQAQREELETVYHSLCQDVSEISGVIQQLRTMSGFGGTVESLRQVQRNGGEQQIKLRQSAVTLGRVAELYRKAELENLDGGSPADWVSSRWFAPVRKTCVMARICAVICEPREMLDGAERWFQMKVVVPQRK